MVATVSKAAHVAQLLLDRILVTGLSSGASLGTESEILAELNVSRPTLRESLRILESYGVVEVKPGPRGGILLRKPSVDVLAHALSVHLSFHDVPFLDVVMAREVIEPTLAAEAAVNGSEQDFARMAESIERMRTIKVQPDFIEENRRFHSAIAAASGNRVLEMFWSTISILAAGEDRGVKYTAANQQHIVKAHTAILEACRARDAALAYQTMAAHLGEQEQLVLSRYRNLMKQTTRVFAKTGRRQA